MMDLRSQKGFTLVELLIVIAIIAVLAMVAVPRFMNMIADSRARSCQANQGTLDTALEQMVALGNAVPASGVIVDAAAAGDAGMIATAAFPDRPLKRLVECPGDDTVADNDYQWDVIARNVDCVDFDSGTTLADNHNL